LLFSYFLPKLCYNDNLNDYKYYSIKLPKITNSFYFAAFIDLKNASFN